MQEKIVEHAASPLWLSFHIRHSVLAFLIVTVALTFGIVQLPLPTLASSRLVIFIPTLVAIGLTSLADPGSRLSFSKGK